MEYTKLEIQKSILNLNNTRRYERENALEALEPDARLRAAKRALDAEIRVQELEKMLADLN